MMRGNRTLSNANSDCDATDGVVFDVDQYDPPGQHVTLGEHSRQEELITTSLAGCAVEDGNK